MIRARNLVINDLRPLTKGFHFNHPASVSVQEEL